MGTQLDFSTRQLANPSAGVQQSLSDLSAMFGNMEKNKIEQARYDAEQARIKIADARIATKWEQEQEAYKRTELRDNLLGTYVQAFKPVTEQSQEVAGVVPNNIQQVGGVQGQPIPVEGSLLTNYTVKYHPGRDSRIITTQSPGKYSNPNPIIQYSPLQPSATIIPPQKNKPEVIKTQDSTQITNGDIVRDKFGRVIDSISNIPLPKELLQNARSWYDKNVIDKVSRPIVEGTAKVLGNSWDAANAPLSERQKVLQGTLQNFVNHTKSNTLLGIAGRESPQQVDKSIQAISSTRLNDIKLDKAYDSNGKVLGDKLLANQKNASQVYFKTRDGKLISSTAYDKGLQAQQASYEAGAVTVKQVPGSAAYYEQVSGTSNKTIPTSGGSRMPTSTFVNKIDTAVDNVKSNDIFNPTTPTRAEQVVSASTSIIDKMLKDNPSLRYSEVAPAVFEAIKQRIPDGSMTDTERNKLDIDKELRGYAHAWKLQQSQNKVSTDNNIRSVNASIANNASSNSVQREGYLLSYKSAQAGSGNKDFITVNGAPMPRKQFEAAVSARGAKEGTESGKSKIEKLAAQNVLIDKEAERIFAQKAGYNPKTFFLNAYDYREEAKRNLGLD